MARTVEDELFLRFVERREPAALAQVFDRLAPDLLRIAQHLSGRMADAEDLLQQTFLAAIENAATWDRSRGLFPWLVGILTNQARLRRRSEARVIDPTRLPGRDATGPVAAAEREEFASAIAAAVEELGEVYGPVLRLHLEHGLNANEIGAALGRPAGSVRTQLVRGLEKLRRALPLGLGVVAAATVSAGRGLSAVREVVVGAAEQAAGLAAAGSAVTTVAMVGGAMAMKKLVLAMVGVLLVGLLWWASGVPGAATTLSPATATPAMPAVATTADGPREVGTPSTAPTDRVDVTPSEGALRVRVVAKLAANEAEFLPVVGAPLQVWSGNSGLPPFDGQSRVCRTGTDGTLQLGHLEPGPWQVSLDVGGREDVPVVQAITIHAGQPSELTFDWPAVRVARGRVVDDVGQPVAGADLWVHRGVYMGRDGRPESSWLVARRAACSDGDGRFLVPLTREEGSIGASKAGYAASFALDTQASTGELRLVLGRGGATLAGTVRTPAGEPVPDALVQLKPAGQDARRAADGTLLLGRVEMLTYSDAQGRFTFEGLPAGKHRLVARASPRYPGWRDVEVGAASPTDVDLILPDGFVMVGKVLQSDGTPAANRGVAARSSLDPNGAYSTCGTRADGSFVLADLPTRRIYVTVGNGARGFLASREIVSPQPSVLRCDFTLDQLASLRGRVVDPTGQPLAGWCVQSAVAGAGNPMRRCDANGAFDLLLPKGERVRVVAFAPDGDARHPAGEVPDAQAGTGPIEIRIQDSAMPSARVTGRLVDPDGRPLAQCGLELVNTDDAWRKLGKASTGDDGRFEFGPCSPQSSKLLLATWGDQTRELARCELRAAEVADLGDLVVAPLAHVVIDVTRTDGSAWQGPLPGFLVRDAGGKHIDSITAQSGRLQSDIEPGHYRLEIGGPDLIAKAQEIDVVAGQQLTLRVAVGIGRSRSLVCNFDGLDRLTSRKLLHLELRNADGALVMGEDLECNQWHLGGHYYWSLDRVLTFGHYEFDAHTEDGRRYRLGFEVRDNLDDPTQIEVPRLGQ